MKDFDGKTMVSKRHNLGDALLANEDNLQHIGTGCRLPVSGSCECKYHMLTFSVKCSATFSLTQ